ncbi:putative toxin-antitoxin system toxin component, PIN family [Caenimonas sedimenti]|uniref:Ribonuclease VapC n=1 Tax=Caenimonas sedimenti TaxID=2596921 RepID=A0A562ZI70_9BURK|nr:putative toxin-antitoxin system toxin component, PIN family [Caenimonas sedimenti]TWO68282.1 putative toxin-antitoxin system toxin component, PIN family [Caenimonas sedimenti]
MRLVLDTNIVLDLLVFRDPAMAPVAAGLADGSFEWLATATMREELARVLAYPKLAPRVGLARGDALAVLADFDRLARVVPPPGRAPLTCGDADDQKFIDLAVAERCVLLSKDADVLRMAKRLGRLEVTAASGLTGFRTTSQ